MLRKQFEIWKANMASIWRPKRFRNFRNNHASVFYDQVSGKFRNSFEISKDEFYLETTPIGPSECRRRQKESQMKIKTEPASTTTSKIPLIEPS